MSSAPNRRFSWAEIRVKFSKGQQNYVKAHLNRCLIMRVKIKTTYLMIKMLVFFVVCQYFPADMFSNTCRIQRALNIFENIF